MDFDTYAGDAVGAHDSGAGYDAGGGVVAMAGQVVVYEDRVGQVVIAEGKLKRWRVGHLLLFGYQVSVD